MYDLNQNIKNYIMDYVDVHITLNSSASGLLFLNLSHKGYKFKTKDKNYKKYYIKIYRFIFKIRYKYGCVKYIITV